MILRDLVICESLPHILFGRNKKEPQWLRCFKRAMETLTDYVSKLSRTELQKQKLAEYLAMKGRQKPPNPKPYLKDSTVLKTNVRANQTSQSGKGKENHVPSAMGAKKDVQTKNTFTKNKNTTSKLELRAMSKTPSAVSSSPSAVPQHLTFKQSLSQTIRQYSRTHSNEESFSRKVSLKPLQAKAPPHSCVGLLQSKTAKMVKHAPVGSISFRAHGSDSKADFSNKGKDSGLHKTVTTPLIRCSNATKKPSNIIQQKNEAKTENRLPKNAIIKADVARSGVTHGQDKRCNGSVQFKEPLACKTKAKPARTQLAQNEPLFQGTQLNKARKNPGPSMQKAPSSAKLSSTLSSASCKTTKVTKPTNVSMAGVKKAVMQQRTTVQLPMNPTVQAPVPHTAPCNSKSSSQTRGAGQPKIPKSTFIPGTQGVRKCPLDGRKKLTAAQEERLRKLQEWREAKGITYKRPPMPVQPVKKRTSAPSHNYWSTMEQEDEVHGFVCAVDQSLNDCIRLIQQGCPVDQVRGVLSRVPMAQKFAKYWICQVRLLEREGNLDVLPTFEEAVRVVRESVDELRSVVFEILKRKEATGSSSSQVDEETQVDDKEEENPHDICTPKPVGVHIHGEKGESSIIKYKITATPSGKRVQQKVNPGEVGGQEIRFFTPVRRSLRIERTAPRFPAALQEHDPCVTSLQDLLTQEEDEGECAHMPEARGSPLYVYRENDALKEHVHVRFIYS